MDLSWEEIAALYETSQERESSADFGDGMLKLVEQLRSEPEFADLQPMMLHGQGLALGIKEVPENLPPGGGFAPSVDFYWTKPDHYRISIGFHETLIVPTDKALEAAKHQLKRLRKLLPSLTLSDEELETWKEHYYRNRTRESISFRYSRLPREWLLTNMQLDLSNYRPKMRIGLSQLRENVKKETVDKELIMKVVEELEVFERYLMAMLEVATEVEETQRSEEFLRRLGGKE